MRKRIFGMVLSALIVTLLPIVAQATDRTRDQALAWAQSQVGKALDYDGVYGAQCVDLIQYYYAYLGVTPVTGNGCDYATNALPSGWQRLQGASPEPGDILVYSGTGSNPAGHVAIYESDYSHYNQNVSGKQYVVKCTWHYAAYEPYWGVIRPNFSDGKTPADLGTNFYAYIFNQPSWKTVACETSGYNVYLETEKWTANQRWYCTRNDDGSYTFKNAANNKCLDVENLGTSNGTNVQAATYNGSDAQKWFLYPVNGYYVLSPKCAPGKVLDLYSGYTSDGTNVQIYDENDSNAQIFTLYTVDAEAGKPSIKSNANYIYTDGSAIVSWDATAYTDHYIYFLTEYPTGYAYTTNTLCGDISGTSVSFKNLTSGSYRSFIHSVSHQNKWGPQSNWVSFKVYEKDYIPAKTVVNNNHIYALYDYEMSWTFARELCEDLGGHLVTVTNLQEEQLVEDLISSGSKNAYWLGATDITEFSTTTFTEKKYTWITGEDFSYSNWASGEPSASGEYGEKEHFAEIRKSYGNKWNDVNNISKNNKGFILEIEIDNHSPVYTEEYEGHTYMLFDKNTTWSEAKVFCEQLGGHLATACSSAENDFIKNLLKNGKRAWYYIGGQKINETWKWLDDSSVNTVSWTDFASAWPGTKLMMYRSNGNCVGIDNAYYPESDIDNIGFVCEIDSVATPPANQAFDIETISEDIQIQTNIEDETMVFTIVSDTIDLDSVQLFVVAYDNGIMQSVSKGNAQISTNSAVITADIPTSEYKVFLWDKNQTPLIKPLHIKQ